MPEQDFALAVPMKNPHWKMVAESVFNRPETGKRFFLRFHTAEEGYIEVLVSRIENRAGCMVFLTGNVVWGQSLSSLGTCGPKNPMKFKIKYDYYNQEGILRIKGIPRRE